MGWTGTYVGRNFSLKDRKEFLDKEFTWSNEKSEVSVIKSSMVGTTYYAAVHRHNDTFDGTFALVCLTSMDNGEFLYKDMDECMGPGAVQCPLSIMKELSPTTEKYAISWREAVYEYHKNKYSKRFKHGDIVECKCPFEIKWSTFKIEPNEIFYTGFLKHRGRINRFVARRKEDLYGSIYILGKAYFDKCETTLVENIGDRYDR